MLLASRKLKICFGPQTSHLKATHLKSLERSQREVKIEIFEEIIK